MTSVLLKKTIEKLGTIHQKGYVHCDIKLENIFIKDNYKDVVIGDF